MKGYICTYITALMMLLAFLGAIFFCLIAAYARDGTFFILAIVLSFCGGYASWVISGRHIR